MERLRTFGIVAHIDAGKTTLTERILYSTGAQPFAGNVDDGTATMDWMPAERARGISITAAATRVSWAEHTLQVVDTPGHVDFTAEVERCLFVLDGVLVVVDGVRGVESQTETVWQQSTQRGLPRLVFVNKLDREGADFAAVVKELGERLECRPLPLVIPLLDDAGQFAGLGDALAGAVQWFDGAPDAATAARIRGELLAAHERVVDFASETDEAILRDALAGQRIAAARLRAVVRQRMLAGAVVPTLCGAALWNRGVDWLLDAAVALLPGIGELPPVGLWSTAGAGDPDHPFLGFVFKVQHVDGEIWNFLRIVRGRLVPGQSFENVGRLDRSLRCPAIWAMRADNHVELAQAEPGEIVVLPGDLGLRTGDTVASSVQLEWIAAPRFPEPVLAVTFEPERVEDIPAVASALAELAADDPTLRVDREADRVVVRGMGELHLEVVADLVRQRTGVKLQPARPRVDRRETVRGEGVGAAEVHAQVAGSDRFARCAVQVVPVAGDLPATVTAADGLPAAEAAREELTERLRHGLKVGEVRGVAVELTAIAVDRAGTLLPLVQQAAAMALAEAMTNAGLVVLEPRVRLEVRCPEESSAPVLADLQAKGAEIEGVAAGRLGAVITGRATLERMLGYVTRLRSLTRGRGQVSLQPAGYGWAEE
jgi:elongation factor G